MLVARFDGDVESLMRAYDEAHRMIMESGGPLESFAIIAP